MDAPANSVTNEDNPDDKSGEENANGTPVVKQMRAIVLSGFGGPKMIKALEKPKPTPKEGEVLVRAKTCGMSFPDLMLRQGLIDNLPKPPIIMGFECAGIVESLGKDVSDLCIGDRVIALTDYKAWAEYVAVPAKCVFKIPDCVGFEDGVCLLMHYVTAYILLFHLANIRKGQSLLIHSVAGGLGQAVVQLCNVVGDVTIFGTASAHKHDSMKDKVSHVFSHDIDYIQEIRKISFDGVDIVLDCLCGEDTNRGISILKPMGKYILYGSSNIITGETKSFFNIPKWWWQVDKVSPIKMFDDNQSVGGFQLRRLMFFQGQSAYIKEVVQKVLELYTQEKIRPVIDSIWAFEDVTEGMQKLYDRKNIGKVLLDPGKEPLQKVPTKSPGQDSENGEMERGEKQDPAGSKE